MQNVLTFAPRPGHAGPADTRRGERGPATILILPAIRVERAAPATSDADEPGSPGLRSGR